MDNEKTLDVLNTLIEINNDRIEGYETASKETKETELQNLFYKLIQTSQKNKAELIQEVVKLGGTPIEGTRITGKFFRVWMDVKAALTGNDRKMILDSCEYGEDVALDVYKDQLKNNFEALTSLQQIMLQAQVLFLKADHDVVKSMRDAAAAAAASDAKE